MNGFSLASDRLKSITKGIALRSFYNTAFKSPNA